MWIECPKCTSPNAWYQNQPPDVVLRCLCGYFKVVETTLEQITTHHIDVGIDVSLPRQKTKLWFCLMMLAGLKVATTQEITFRLNLSRIRKKDGFFTVSDIASQLTVLRYKGLVLPIENRKGLLGGSTWQLTEDAKLLLGK